MIPPGKDAGAKARGCQTMSCVAEPRRLAGKLSFGGTHAIGPRVDVEFDAALLKEFKAAR